MTWRDTPFDADSNLCVVGPVTPEAIDRALSGFRTWARSGRSTPYRWYRSSSGERWRRVKQPDLERHIEASIITVPGPADVVRLENIARSLDYTHFGAILIVAADAVALSFSHRFSDGMAGLVELQSILGGRDVPERPITRFPVLRALVATRQLSASGLRAGRAFLRDFHPMLAVAPLAEPGRVADTRTVIVSDFSLPAALITAFAAAERRSGTTAPTSAIIMALTFRAMRRCLPDGVDLPVGVIIGLRRHLPEHLDAEGNFLLSACVGTLRQRVWTSAQVRDHVLARVADPVAVAAYAVVGLARIRGAVASLVRPRRLAGRPLQLDLSIIPRGIGIAADDYLPGRSPRPGLVLLHRGPVIGPHCTITVTGKDYIVTTVDDSATLDLSRLEDSFRRELNAANSPDLQGRSE